MANTELFNFFSGGVCIIRDMDIGVTMVAIYNESKDSWIGWQNNSRSVVPMTSSIEVIEVIRQGTTPTIIEPLDIGAVVQLKEGYAVKLQNAPDYLRWWKSSTGTRYAWEALVPQLARPSKLKVKKNG